MALGISQEFYSLLSDRHLPPDLICHVVILAQAALWRQRMLRDHSRQSNPASQSHGTEFRILSCLLRFQRSLFEVGLDQLKDLPSPDTREGDLAQQITAVLRRTLPAVRICSKWLRSNFGYVNKWAEERPQPSKDKRSRAVRADDMLSKRQKEIREFWDVYARFARVLSRAFPSGRLPQFEGQLDEDVDMRGFLPLKGLMDPREESLGSGLSENREQHPNVLELMRISDLIEDTKQMVQSEVCSFDTACPRQDFMLVRAPLSPFTVTSLFLRVSRPQIPPPFCSQNHTRNIQPVLLLVQTEMTIFRLEILTTMLFVRLLASWIIGPPTTTSSMMMSWRKLYGTHGMCPIFAVICSISWLTSGDMTPNLVDVPTQRRIHNTRQEDPVHSAPILVDTSPGTIGTSRVTQPTSSITAGDLLANIMGQAGESRSRVSSGQQLSSPTTLGPSIWSASNDEQDLTFGPQRSPQRSRDPWNPALYAAHPHPGPVPPLAPGPYPPPEIYPSAALSNLTIGPYSQPESMFHPSQASQMSSYDPFGDPGTQHTFAHLHEHPEHSYIPGPPPLHSQHYRTFEGSHIPDHAYDNYQHSNQPVHTPVWGNTG